MHENSPAGVFFLFRLTASNYECQCQVRVGAGMDTSIVNSGQCRKWKVESGKRKAAST